MEYPVNKMDKKRAMEDLEVMITQNDSLRLHIARRIVFTDLPRRILELKKILEAEKFSQASCDEFDRYLDKLRDFKVPPLNNKRLLNEEESTAHVNVLLKNDVFVPNPIIADLQRVIINFVNEAKSSLRILKTWVELMRPVVLAGHNFGHAVQTSIIAELSNLRMAVNAIALENYNYTTDRVAALHLLFKYPFVSDLVESVCQMDDHEFRSLRLRFIGLLSNYLATQELMSKNFSRLQSPR